MPAQAPDSYVCSGASLPPVPCLGSARVAPRMVPLAGTHRRQGSSGKAAVQLAVAAVPPVGYAVGMIQNRDQHQEDTMTATYEPTEAGYRQMLKDLGWSTQKVTAAMTQLKKAKPERVEDFENFQARFSPKQPQRVQVTVSDEEYSELLRIRLNAKHAWEAEQISDEEYNEARAAVRRARRIRRSEGAVVENYRQQSAPQHNAMTRRIAA